MRIEVISGVNDLATVCPKIAEEWHPTKNGDLKPTDIIAGSRKKVWWYLPYDVPEDYPIESLRGKHFDFEWLSTISHRSHGIGCPFLTNHSVWVGFNDLTTINPKLAEEWHPFKNGNLKPTDVTPGSGKKVWWKCNVCGRDWIASVTSRNSGRGCQWCAKEKQTSFPEQSIYFYVKKVFPDAISQDTSMGRELDVFIPSLNVGIEYDGERFHQKTERDINKRKYFHKKHIRVINIRESGCPNIFEDDVIRRADNSDQSLNNCIKTLINMLGQSLNDIDVNIDRTLILESYVSGIKENSIAVKRPSLVKEWDSEKNGCLSPEMISYGSGKKVWWICDQGHTWLASITHRSDGHGCPFCSGRVAIIGENDLQTVRPDLMKEWNYQKNNDLLPSTILPNSGKKVWWRCNVCGNEWLESPHRRSSGSGCPCCSRKKQSKEST